VVLLFGPGCIHKNARPTLTPFHSKRNDWAVWTYQTVHFAASRVCTYVSVCLSVCHKPEMRENGSTDRVSFGTEILSSCIRRIFVYPKKGTSFWNCVVSKEITKKVKVAHTRLPSVGFRSWSRFFAVSLQVTWVINRAVGCHYFSPGPQLPSQPLTGA